MTRKSKAVRLLVLGGLGLAAGCNRGEVWDERTAQPKDPCDQEYFNEQLCQEAVGRNGYFYGGSWHPRVYMHPYPYFFQQHSAWVNSGGRSTGINREYYSPSFRPPPIGGRVGVSRGGFGSSFGRSWGS